MPYESPPVDDISFDVDGAYTAPSTSSLDFDFTDESVASATATQTTVTSTPTEPTSTASTAPTSTTLSVTSTSTQPTSTVTVTPTSTTLSATSTPTTPTTTTRSTVSVSPTSAVPAQTSPQSSATSTATGTPTTQAALLPTASGSITEQVAAVQTGATTTTTQPVAGTTTTVLSSETDATSILATPGVTTDTSVSAVSAQASSVLQKPVASILTNVAGGVIQTSTPTVAAGTSQTDSTGTTVGSQSTSLDPMVAVGVTPTANVVTEIAELSAPTVFARTLGASSVTPVTTSLQPADAIGGVDVGATMVTESAQPTPTAGTAFSTPSAQTVGADTELTLPSAVSIQAPESTLNLFLNISRGDGRLQPIDTSGNRQAILADITALQGLDLDGDGNAYVVAEKESTLDIVARSYDNTGTLRWETVLDDPIGKYDVSVTNDGVVYVDDDQSLYDGLSVIDAGTGDIVASIETPVEQNDSAVDANGRLYLSGDTELGCVTSDGTEYTVPANNAQSILVGPNSDYFYVHMAGDGEIQKRSTNDGSVVATRTFTQSNVDFGAINLFGTIYFVNNTDDTVNAFDFAGGSVSWTVSSAASIADVDYRPDEGAFVARKDPTEDRTNLERVSADGFGTTLFSRPAFVESVTKLSVYPNVGSHPSQWEPRSAEYGLQSKHIDVSSTTSAPTASTQTTPSAELTPATSAPQTGAGSASTTLTPASPTVAPVLNTSSGTAATGAGATAAGATSVLFAPSGTAQTSGTATDVVVTETTRTPTAISESVLSVNSTQATSKLATSVGTTQTTAGASLHTTTTVPTVGDGVAAVVADAGESIVASTTLLTPRKVALNSGSATAAQLVATPSIFTSTIESAGSALGVGVSTEPTPFVADGLARSSVAAQTHSAVATTREPFRFTPRVSGPTDGPNTTTAVSRRNQLSLGDSTNTLDTASGSNESTLDVSDTEIDVEANRETDTENTE